MLASRLHERSTVGDAYYLGRLNKARKSLSVPFKSCISWQYSKRDDLENSRRPTENTRYMDNQARWDAYAETAHTRNLGTKLILDPRWFHAQRTVRRGLPEKTANPQRNIKRVCTLTNHSTRKRNNFRRRYKHVEH
jgi:hypothetical protein